MRRIVKPLESLLVSHKRIVLKDSAVREWCVCVCVRVYSMCVCCVHACLLSMGVC